jgi:hypothetical protein
MTEPLSSHTTEPGRIARHATQANQPGWKRWFPGLNTLRGYESSWLRHDLVAVVGSRASAILLRFRLSVSPRFLWVGIELRFPRPPYNAGQPHFTGPV